jgi:hypothetical protein
MIDCLIPPPLADEALLAYLAEPGDAAIRQHLQRCPACAARLKQWARTTHKLASALYRFDCPSAHDLSDYLLGLLNPARRAVVEQHLQDCPHCPGELQRLKSELSRVSSPAPGIGLIDLIDKVLAQLVPTSPTLALRGTAAPQILAEADRTLIALKPQPAPGENFIVVGQITDEAQDRWTEATVEFLREDGSWHSATVDDLGLFTSPALPAGEVTVHLVPRTGRAIVMPVVKLAG